MPCRASAFWMPAGRSLVVRTKNECLRCSMSPRGRLARLGTTAKGPLSSFCLVPSLASLPRSQLSFQEWIWAGLSSHLGPCAPAVAEGQEDWLGCLALAVECFYLEATWVTSVHISFAKASHAAVPNPVGVCVCPGECPGGELPVLAATITVHHGACSLAGISGREPGSLHVSVQHWGAGLQGALRTVGTKEGS